MQVYFVSVKTFVSDYTLYVSVSQILETLLLCKSYHHAKRRHSANQHRSNQLRGNHLSPPAVKRLSITLSDMQNRTQSQTSGVMISNQNISPPKALPRSIKKSTFRSITAGTRGITDVRITGISQWRLGG